MPTSILIIDLLSHACGRNNDREHVDLEFLFEAHSEACQPPILSEVSRFLSCGGTLKFDPGEILKMMNHLVDQN